ncbi:MAG: Holliday junction branch migration protein RuvA [Fibrobacter sp.]|mgnify:CR=1 FL=1|jgi:Holliday junction DNA helicase RuvA|nr:Holliday junction branch migration protein RuvA [Fibrobacter sp.]
MIEYIKGTLTEKEVTRVAIEAHGVGYNISIPLSTYEKLPETGTNLLLHIHYLVREDAHKLYGFLSKTEREMFRHLIGITKIGPKVALSVLSGITVDDLVNCINSGDSRRLEKIPGVGQKTAQRLLIELKGKVGSSLVSGISEGALAVNSGNLKIRDEAFAAMVSLGYNDKQVQKAFARVEQAVSANAPVEEWIRKALQII